jgi:hypothetical protein
MPKTRPIGVTALSIFFLAGAGISFTSCVSVIFPGSLLEPMWRINPRVREAFTEIGVWAIVLLCAVCIACLLSAVGLWQGRWWGHRLAVILIAINLAGDIVNVVLGTEPRGAVGIPIAAAIIVYLLSSRVREFFKTSLRMDQ